MKTYKEILPVVIALPPDWKVEIHQLMDISPKDADNVSHPVETAWQLWFNEDMFIAINVKNQKVIDVGWFPVADPLGNYCVSFCKLRELGQRRGRPRFGPGDVISTRRTRDLDEVVRLIESIATENERGT